MNKDEIKGKVDDVVGRAKRKIGEATDDTELQGEGLGQQAKGKIQNAWGNVKEGAKDLKNDAERKMDRHDEDVKDKDKDRDENAA